MRGGEEEAEQATAGTDHNALHAPSEGPESAFEGLTAKKLSTASSQFKAWPLTAEARRNSPKPGFVRTLTDAGKALFHWVFSAPERFHPYKDGIVRFPSVYRLLERFSEHTTCCRHIAESHKRVQ
jgi:hypothetical protein